LLGFQFCNPIRQVLMLAIEPGRAVFVGDRLGLGEFVEGAG